VLTLWASGPPAERATAAAAATTAALNPPDGTDPYLDRCGSDQLRIEQRTWPLYLPNGRPYGRLALYHSSACRANWGYVYGPNSPSWTVVIVARRLGDDLASSTTSFRGAIAPDSWGNGQSCGVAASLNVR
jgi:hypothetical protein